MFEGVKHLFKKKNPPVLVEFFNKHTIAIRFVKYLKCAMWWLNIYIYIVKEFSPSS